MDLTNICTYFINSVTLAVLQNNSEKVLLQWTRIFKTLSLRFCMIRWLRCLFCTYLSAVAKLWHCIDTRNIYPCVSLNKHYIQTFSYESHRSQSYTWLYIKSRTILSYTDQFLRWISFSVYEIDEFIEVVRKIKIC